MLSSSIIYARPFPSRDDARDSRSSLHQCAAAMRNSRQYHSQHSAALHAWRFSSTHFGSGEHAQGAILVRENEEVVRLPIQLEAGQHSEPAVLNREWVRTLALEAGFTEAGLVALPHIHQERDAARFEEWVRAGRAGTMRYLERTGRGWAVCCARGLEHRFLGRARRWFALRTTTARSRARWSRQPRERDGLRATPGRAKWMRTGNRRPTDYHKVLLKRMKTLEVAAA